MSHEATKGALTAEATKIFVKGIDVRQVVIKPQPNVQKLWYFLSGFGLRGFTVENI